MFVLNGHEATVCSVAVDEDKIVSGGADKVRSVDTLVMAEKNVSNGKRSMSSKRPMGRVYLRFVGPFTRRNLQERKMFIGS